MDGQLHRPNWALRITTTKRKTMLLRSILVALALLFPSISQAQTLLYKNTCPAPSQSDPTYLAGVQAIRDAIDAGKTITVSMSYLEGGQYSKFTVQFSAIKASTNYVSGLIMLRPPLNNDAQAIAGTSLFVGSVDSLGNYRWGYLNGSSITSQSCYENAWWAH